MTPPTTEQTQLIHSQYKALTGLNVPYTMKSYFMWSAYLARGLGEPDLACMVRYIKSKMKPRGPRTKESLLMENMVKDLDTFVEYLSIARAEARNSTTQTPRQEMLRAAGRPEQPPEQCKPVKDVLAGAKAFEDFRKWRLENGI